MLAAAAIDKFGAGQADHRFRNAALESLPCPSAPMYWFRKAARSELLPLKGWRPISIHSGGLPPGEQGSPFKFGLPNVAGCHCIHHSAWIDNSIIFCNILSYYYFLIPNDVPEIYLGFQINLPWNYGLWVDWPLAQLSGFWCFLHHTQAQLDDMALLNNPIAR